MVRFPCRNVVDVLVNVCCFASIQSMSWFHMIWIKISFTIKFEKVHFLASFYIDFIQFLYEYLLNKFYCNLNIHACLTIEEISITSVLIENYCEIRIKLQKMRKKYGLRIHRQTKKKLCLQFSHRH